ncbi:MAG: hypothetical protein M0R80_08815 [Proteobacteria bacterium]|jgi:hypothetical protein|nr:hypothetical protein [Pseudomonadota bacterium]
MEFRDFIEASKHPAHFAYFRPNQKGVPYYLQQQYGISPYVSSKTKTANIDGRDIEIPAWTNAPAYAAANIHAGTMKTFLQKYDRLGEPPQEPQHDLIKQWFGEIMPGLQVDIVPDGLIVSGPSIHSITPKDLQNKVQNQAKYNSLSAKQSVNTLTPGEQKELADLETIRNLNWYRAGKTVTQDGTEIIFVPHNNWVTTHRKAPQRSKRSY